MHSAITWAIWGMHASKKTVPAPGKKHAGRKPLTCHYYHYGRNPRLEAPRQSCKYVGSSGFAIKGPRIESG